MQCYLSDMLSYLEAGDAVCLCVVCWERSVCGNVRIQLCTLFFPSRYSGSFASFLHLKASMVSSIAVRAAQMDSFITQRAKPDI